MIFQHPQINQTTEVLNDLVRINNDRVEGFQKALSQSANLITELRDAFYVIISDGLNYKQQLTLKIKQFGELDGNGNVPGKIFRAWTDLKGVFAFGSQKLIISSCMYNEEVALHAYGAALCTDNIRRADEIFQMISDHEKGLKENHNLLKGYREIRQPAYARLMYLA